VVPTVLDELGALLCGWSADVTVGAGAGLPAVNWLPGSGSWLARFPAPLWVRTRRWSLAAPCHPQRAPFALHPSLVGVCGDAWGPRPRIEQAWMSGHLLGAELLRRLGG
jgi:predicted NAD/FAD-dependent oxidoreductase